MYLKHSVEAGLHLAKKLPGDWYEKVSKQSELVNAPRIGSEDNGMWANVLMNIASAKHQDGQCVSVCDLSAFI